MFFSSKTSKVNTDPSAISSILNRGVVADILPSREAFMQVMTSGKRLRFYIGADPTGSALHLGHAGNLLLLEEFRKLGHEVIMLFGDFTARIGDPSGKSTARRPLSKDEIEVHMKEWGRQIRPLLGFDDRSNPPLIKQNSVWLQDLTFEGILNLAGQFTVQQMIERDMFEKRLKAGAPIHLHEFLYPLMQGFDSVAMDVDVELAGTDQTFNMLAGRTLQKKLNHKEKFVVTTNLLANPETGEMMSKSAGTGVFLGQSATDMYGAIMAQSDPMVRPLFLNVTRVPLDEIERVCAGNMKEAKMRVAREIATIVHGTEAAEEAERQFEKTFSKKELPDGIVEIRGGGLLIDAVVPEIVSSKSEFRRLVLQGAIRHRDTDKKIDSPLATADPGVYQIGPRRFIKIVG